jgi:hypothetical protein
MKLDNLDFAPHADTLVAVVLGALLATLSGFAATLLESWFKRRERERDSALFFGELFSGLDVILQGAVGARGRGEPYGPITMRMLRVARRELDTYDRNRAGLYDLRDSDLRTAVHSLVVRMTIPIDGLIEGVDSTNEVRDLGFEFLLEGHAEIGPLVERLGKIARHSFAGYADAARGPRFPG